MLMEWAQRVLRGDTAENETDCILLITLLQIAPTFTVVIAGALLRRSFGATESFWKTLEQLT
ncbi:hypothetical protein PsAD2_01380 [Pseudovibrio axinellae]|uniref:Uncharacterized protein n=2 Tax=Pseudovibrio axinellae TaxID=989403 RepID=A0A166A1H3_9HYPH|nr:hypothetical protein PsAD2_01380 [Pseudovibrio axinellae]SEQ91155.1 hypothetical protein SAMN05421798_10590 [Pseudovibrio axinellae]